MLCYVLAVLTLIRFLFGMGSNVIFEASRMYKAFLAVHTLIRFLFDMSFYVIPQVTQM